MFRKLNKSQNDGCSVIRCARDMRVSQFYQPSTIDSFLIQKHESVADGVPSIRMTSDIYMLFNQQRLDRMSREAIVNHFNDMVVHNPQLTALKSKLSDDQLISLVKSRYIEQPSELLAWSMYLNTLADAELQAVVAESQKQTEKTEPAVDVSQTVSPGVSAE